MSKPQPKLTVERIEDSAQYYVRRDGLRIGVVVGANGVFCAETTKGKHIGRAKTAMGAAALVLNHRQKVSDSNLPNANN